jgi:hypothetical protein
MDAHTAERNKGIHPRGDARELRCVDVIAGLETRRNASGLVASKSARCVDRELRFQFSWRTVVRKMTAKTFEIKDPLLLISAKRPSCSAQTSYAILREKRSPTYFSRWEFLEFVPGPECPIV